MAFETVIATITVDADALRNREGYVSTASVASIITELLEGLLGPERDPHSGAEIGPAITSDVFVHEEN